jgi:UDP-glucose 4-epimerase
MGEVVLMFNDESSVIAGKKLLIFGGAGSLGNCLVDYYKDIAEEIIVVSRDEAKHWELKNKFKIPNLKTIICDVRDPRRVSQILRSENPTNIIIAQALKQVDTCENQPSESIDTNILGVRNIIDAIEENSFRQDNKIENVCFVSTDKACNPINVYGMCKSISEKMISAVAKNNTVKYVITRYGNVISSKGSIVPLFLKQSKENKSFTVTDPEMTRFMMLLEESVRLIDTAMTHGISGSLWIPKLDSFNVMDLALFFSERYDKPIEIVGVRPGEKIHEILMNESEDAFRKEHFQTFVINHGTETRRLGAIEYSSRDHVISREELKSRMEEFLERDSYVKNFRKGSRLGS